MSQNRISQLIDENAGGRQGRPALYALAIVAVVVFCVFFLWACKPDYTADALEVGYTQAGATQYAAACSHAVAAHKAVPDVYEYAHHHHELIDETRDSELSHLSSEKWGFSNPDTNSR